MIRPFSQTTPNAGKAPTNGSPRETKNLKVDVELVLVPVTVTDQHNRLVTGLTADNFTLYEGREAEVVAHFSSEDAPISLGVIFDTSDSMYGKIEKSREAVLEFFRSANAQDEFFLVAFSNHPEVAVDFTNSVDDIQTEITKAVPDGLTGLLDAVYLSFDVMKRARNQRKALLMVSDGGDNHSRYTARDLISVVREADVQIYAMGIFEEAPRTKAERVGPDLLRAITDVTGGRTFPIHNLKKIREATDELALELRNQYLIAYRPRNLVHDGKWHKISIRVKPAEGSAKLHVYAKTGYYAPTK